jgi:hypothetical protein
VTAPTSIAARLAVSALAAILSSPDAAQGAEPAPRLELRGEASFPLQYGQSYTAASQQTAHTIAPFGGLMATAHLQNDWSTSVFASGGHDQLGRFRDNDDTFASFGGNVVKRWGAFLGGLSVEHTHFYDGTFGATSNIANDVTVFGRYNTILGRDLRVTPMIGAALRLDDNFSAERVSLALSLDIERRLTGSWWLIARPRIRASAYLGEQAGRQDLAMSLVAGARYYFNDNVSFTALAGGESRSSTDFDRRREKFIVGASLDFDIVLARWR